MKNIVKTIVLFSLILTLFGCENNESNNEIKNENTNITDNLNNDNTNENNDTNSNDENKDITNNMNLADDNSDVYGSINNLSTLDEYEGYRLDKLCKLLANSENHQNLIGKKVVISCGLSVYPKWDENDNMTVTIFANTYTDTTYEILIKDEYKLTETETIDFEQSIVLYGVIGVTENNVPFIAMNHLRQNHIHVYGGNHKVQIVDVTDINNNLDLFVGTEFYVKARLVKHDKPTASEFDQCIEDENNVFLVDNNGYKIQVGHIATKLPENGDGKSEYMLIRAVLKKIDIKDEYDKIKETRYELNILERIKLTDNIKIEKFNQERYIVEKKLTIDELVENKDKYVGKLVEVNGKTVAYYYQPEEWDTLDNALEGERESIKVKTNIRNNMTDGYVQFKNGEWHTLRGKLVKEDDIYYFYCYFWQ